MTDRSKGEVWVFAEQEEGRLAEIPFELLGKARELASKLGVKVGAVLMGEGVAPCAAALVAGGADVVHLVDDPALKVFRSKAYRHALVELIKEEQPQIVIFGATHMGRDLAPAVASALRCGLTADCTDLQIGDYTDKKTGETFANVLHQIRPAFGGNIIATIVNARHWPQMATVREGVMKPLDAAARDLITEAGYGAYFNHRLGHFIGQTDHEKGDVSSANTAVARPGMIFSIEPGIYLPGEFGVRVEDLVLVTETGCEVLNRNDKHWDVVGL